MFILKRYLPDRDLLWELPDKWRKKVQKEKKEKKKKRTGAAANAPKAKSTHPTSTSSKKCKGRLKVN